MRGRADRSDLICQLGFPLAFSNKTPFHCRVLGLGHIPTPPTSPCSGTYIGETSELHKPFVFRQLVRSLTLGNRTLLYRRVQ